MKYMDYPEINKRWASHPLLLAELPTGMTLSLPLPSKRWGAPAYAWFASPTRRVGSVWEQSPPDRWFVVDAASARLMVYARQDSLPFADASQWSATTLPLLPRPIAELKTIQSKLQECMTAVAAQFFADHPGDAAARRALLAYLIESVAPPILPQHRALTPDFFSWLET